MSESLILASKRDEDRRFAEQVSAESLIPMRYTTGIQDAVLLAASLAKPILFVDVSSQQEFEHFHSVLGSAIKCDQEKFSSNRIHLITTEGWKEAEHASTHNLFGHLIIRNESCPEEAGKIYGKILQQVERGATPGLSQLLAKGAPVNSISIAMSENKEQALQQIRELLGASLGGQQGRLIDFVANAADELLMNAIYDAPAAANQGRDTLDRLAKVELTGQRKVEILLGVDEDYIGLSVIDQFGSLNKSKLLMHMLRTYKDNEYKIDPTVAGAGIGLALTFRGGASLLFHSELGVRTEATILARNTKKWRDFRTQFKFISVHVKAPPK